MNKKILICLVALLACLPAMAQFPRGMQQPRFSPELSQQVRQLTTAAMQSDYAYRQLAHLTENIGPRLTGSPQADAAAHYVRDELQKLGLDARLEPVMVPHWVRGAESAELVEWPGMPQGVKQKIVVTALGGSIATPPEGVTAEVVVVTNLDELNALGEKVRGKIVLYNNKYDVRMAHQGFGEEAYGRGVLYRAIGAAAAAKLGAVASVVRSVGAADYRLPHTGAMFGAEGQPTVPAGAVTAEDADLIADLAKQGPVKMHLLLTPQKLPDVQSYNVVADVKGSEHPEQVVIVSGHLDSWDLGTGAIDDGAGVVVAMETANLIKKLGLTPKRTIRVIAWMNEENGTRGGNGYADEHKADAANHVGAIESDLGAGHPVGFHAHITRADAAALAPLSDLLGDIGATLIDRTDDAPGTDIGPLDKLGVPTFGIWQDSRKYFEYHHTAADTLDKVKPNELQENAATMAALAWTLANMPQPPQHNPPHQGGE